MLRAGELPELLLDQSPGCAWLLGPGHRFEAVYGDAQEVFGRPPAGLIGLCFTDLCPPQTRPFWNSQVELALGGETASAAGQFGESETLFLITLYPVKLESGEIAFAGGMARESTERTLALKTLRALEADRSRLAKLLHDQVGQHLSVAGLQLDLLRMDLVEAAVPVEQRTSEIQATLDTVMRLVRDLSHELDPAIAERLGLRAALDRLAGRLRSEFTGTVRVMVDPGAEPPPEAAASLYRIAVEAAANAVRHAACYSIEILLKSMRNGPTLEVRDDGKGFNPSSQGIRERGLGLLVMGHYAVRAGIELHIESSPGRGTVVRATCLSCGRVQV